MAEVMLHANIVPSNATTVITVTRLLNTAEDDSHTSSEHPSDCVICKCFALLKMQVVASSLSTVTSVPFVCESFAAYERLVAFDFTLLPKPRGPPVIQV